MGLTVVSRGEKGGERERSMGYRRPMMKRVHGSTKINSSEIIICVHFTDLSYDALATCAYNYYASAF